MTAAFRVGNILLALLLWDRRRIDAFENRVGTYRFDGYELTYRHKPAARGFEGEAPFLFVHPVGIGLSSWFWNKCFDNWVGPAVYAPNLIGCGISDGGDPWNPDERGLAFPLSWAKGCEALIAALRAPRWNVVTQGGLAPVGVLLAHRNPDAVEKLVLASPPTWSDMTVPPPQQELRRNYDFLRSKIWGNLAFAVLETRPAVEFFSNLFLFSEPCDQAWLDNTAREMSERARPPVIAFNAGLCLHRSLGQELTQIKQPTLVLTGVGDKRERQEYAEKMRICRIQKLPGTNVLPWESPTNFAEACLGFEQLVEQQ